jgi:hypothetical protein
MLAPFGVLREPHIGSGRKPGPGQRLGVLDKQVGRRPAVRSRTEVRLHAEMNLRAIEGDEAVAAALPLVGTETKPAVVGKGSGQVTNGEDRCYSRTHDCNLSRPARAVQTAHVLDEMRVRPLTELSVLLVEESGGKHSAKTRSPFDTPGARAQALVRTPAAFRRRGVSSLTMR